MLRKTILLSVIGLISLLGAASCTHGLAIGAHHHYILAEAEADYRAHHYSEAFRKTYYLTKTGDPRAEYALGNMYFYGHGTVLDQDLARYWIRRAAYKHYPPAEHALYLLERSNVPQDPPANNFHTGYPKWKALKQKPYCVFANDRLRPARSLDPARSLGPNQRPVCVVTHPLKADAQIVNDRRPKIATRVMPIMPSLVHHKRVVKQAKKETNPVVNHTLRVKHASPGKEVKLVNLPVPMFTHVKLAAKPKVRVKHFPPMARGKKVSIESIEKLGKRAVKSNMPTTITTTQFSGISQLATEGMI